MCDDSDSNDEDYMPSGGESDIEIPEDEDVVKEAEETVEEYKKKADDIWSSFMKDVGGIIKSKTLPSQKKAAPDDAKIADSKPTTSDSSSNLADRSTDAADSSTATAAVNGSIDTAASVDTSKPEKVIINKVYDFAGEKITVEKEVASDSKEAKSESPGSRVGVSALKRPAGGLASIMGKITAKKTKMGVLQKSQMDWKQFKTQEELTEELDQYKKSKDGYLNKQDFLERTDHRQFEIEKNLREVNRRSNR